MSGLAIDGLVVRFGDRAAVDGVDLAVAEGEVVALLGPSGCGKSTLLRAVAGLEQPAEGHIAWAGTDLAGVPPHRRGIGLVFQDYALFPHLDVAANVAFGLRMQGRSKTAIAARTAQVLELVGLEGEGGRSVGHLSGGEQQRVALARALAPEPRILLLDEPLGSLDRALRERLLAELAELLPRLGVTALHVTHDQDEAFAIGGRVAVMETGRLLQVGPPAALWTAPATRSVATFLGFPVLEATLSDGVASGPWGTFPVAVAGRDGPALLALRPDALSLESPVDATRAEGRSDGHRECGPSPATERFDGLPGTVLTVTFRAGSTVATVDTAAGPVDVMIDSIGALEPGSAVIVHVDPERVAIVAP